MKKLFTLSLICFLISSNTFSQKQTQDVLDKLAMSVELNGESFTEEYKVQVNSNYLNANINGKISDGKFWVTIYDPKGKKQNGFGLDASKPGSTAKGSLSESKDDAMKGVWTIKFENNKASGRVRFNFKDNTH